MTATALERPARYPTCASAGLTWRPESDPCLAMATSIPVPNPRQDSGPRENRDRLRSGRLGLAARGIPPQVRGNAALLSRASTRTALLAGIVAGNHYTRGRVFAEGLRHGGGRGLSGLASSPRGTCARRSRRLNGRCPPEAQSRSLTMPRSIQRKQPAKRTYPAVEPSIRLRIPTRTYQITAHCVIVIPAR